MRAAVPDFDLPEIKPVFGNGKPLAWEPKDNGSRPRRFQLVPFARIKMDTRPRYCVAGLLPRTGLVVVWGAPKSGKSFFTSDLTLHVALGWPYRGRRTKQGAVVYCALEGGNGFAARAEAFRQRYLPEDAGEVPFFFVDARFTLGADHAELIADIRAQEAQPQVVVIDTLNRSIGGSESDDRDMSAFIRAADAIRDAFDCLVIVVHHCGHEATRPRGHSSLIGAADAQISVKRDAAENVVATVEFMKDGQAGDAVLSRLSVVEVGHDEDGEPITSCVVEAVDGAAEPTGKPERITKAARIALKALYEALDDAGEVPPACPQIPARTKAVPLDVWRSMAADRGISTAGTPDALRKAFARATEDLIAAGKVAVWQRWAWTVG